MIIGLLLGAVLRGQELITSARVRNVISQQESIKTAFFAFQDRYHAIPGDYQLAAANIPNVPAWAIGNGNGQVEANEATLVWMHLARAGFITGAYTMAASGEAASQANTPMNAFGGLIQLVSDSTYLNAGSPRLNLKTGPLVPATLAAEIDRKIDDGIPGTGAFRFSAFGGAVATCLNGEAWAATDEVNCGGAYLF